jgi:hypothetical protein
MWAENYRADELQQWQDRVSGFEAEAQHWYHKYADLVLELELAREPGSNGQN